MEDLYGNKQPITSCVKRNTFFDNYAMPKKTLLHNSMGTT